MRARIGICVGLVVFAVLAAAGQSARTDARVEFTRKLVAAAVARASVHVKYVPAYVRIPYPGGDVPADTGVCTDEIIRIYRAVGIDLQKEVHEDMARNFAAYPQIWHRTSPDSNIDHRRVPNLSKFFERNGVALAKSQQARDYVPGDIVTWDLGGGQTHIGMVVDQKGFFSGRYKVLHNIGRGPQIEDVLFAWKITGHFQYYGPSMSRSARGSR